MFYEPLALGLGISIRVIERTRGKNRRWFRSDGCVVGPLHRRPWRIAEDHVRIAWIRTHGRRPREGCRLAPGIFHAVAEAWAALGGTPSSSELHAECERRRKTTRVKLPAVRHLAALLQWLESQGALVAVLQRHSAGGEYDAVSRAVSAALIAVRSR